MKGSVQKSIARNQKGLDFNCDIFPVIIPNLLTPPFLFCKMRIILLITYGCGD